MAHFAQVDGGIVRIVVVVDNDAIGGGTFPDSEALGQALLEQSGFTGTWVQCSYSGAFRGTYPSPGYAYDPGTGFSAPPQE